MPETWVYLAPFLAPTMGITIEGHNKTKEVNLNLDRTNGFRAEMNRQLHKYICLECDTSD